MSCTFCDVANSKLKVAKVIESTHALAFLDKYPVVEGHCLVIPKKHYENLWSLPEVELTDYIQLVAKVQKLITSNLNCEGADLRQHYRPFLEESELTKHHIHFHILPRTYNDEIFQKSLKYHESLRTKPTLKELEKTAQNIIKNKKTPICRPAQAQSDD